MRQTRIVLSISVLVMALLACQAVTRLRTAQSEIPAMLTAAPTMLGALGTAAAEFTPPAPGTGTEQPADGSSNSAGGLGIKLADVKSILEATQQFTFTDGSLNGQPAAIASLSSDFAASAPALADGFSAVFAGDPKNLNEIKITIPYSDDQKVVQAGLSMMTVLFAGILPPDVLISFMPWVTDNYSKLQVDGTQEMTARNFKFTLSRTQTSVVLDITPVN